MEHCSDSAAVVAIVNTCWAKYKVLTHFLQCTIFVAAYLHLHVHAVHVPGHTNIAADALSWNEFTHFLQVVLKVARQPTSIP